MSFRRHALVLSAIVALGALLRLVDLGRDGLWTDEATTVVLAQRPLPQLLAALRADVQSPLHYLVARAALAAFGDAEWVPRLPSALAGIAAVLLCGALGRRRLGDAGSLFAAFVLALLPLHVAYSREARAYALLGLFALLAFVAVDALRREPSWGRAALAGVAVAALPLTHGLGALQAAAIALAAALPAWSGCREWTRRALPKLAAAGALSIALTAPWLGAMAGQGARSGVTYAWAQPAWDAAFPWQVPLSLLALAPGASAPERSLWWGPTARDAAAGLVLAALLGLAIAARRRVPDPAAVVRLLAAVAGSLLLVFAASLALGPLHVVGRVEAGLAPLFALALGAGAARLGRRQLAAACVGVAALSVAPLRDALTRDVRSSERRLGRALLAHVGERDALVVLGAWRFPVEHYVVRERPGVVLAGFPPEREEHPSWMDWTGVTEARLAADAATLAERLERSDAPSIWLVALPEPGTAPLRAALSSRFRLAGSLPIPIPGLTVERFDRRSERPSDDAAPREERAPHP